MGLLERLTGKRRAPSPKPGKIGDIIAFHKYKTLYVAIPKVANSSLKALSVDILSDDLPDEYTSVDWKPRIFRTAEGRRYLRENDILLDRTSIERFSDYWKFAFVRNPWDRLVSCYANKIRSPEITDNNLKNGVARQFVQYGDVFWGGMPFADFVSAVAGIDDAIADSHIRSQHTFVSTADGEVFADFIGRFEDIDADFAQIKAQCGFPDSVQLPHLLQSKRKAYESYYDSNLIDRVGARYERDVEMFGYEFSGLVRMPAK